jgi:dihydrodipicolinate synthase/N-acetylneuraminate lyase
MSADSLLALAGARGVTSVVVNMRPAFSPALAPAVLAALRERYPSGEQVGQFLVLW